MPIIDNPVPFVTGITQLGLANTVEGRFGPSRLWHLGLAQFDTRVIAADLSPPANTLLGLWHDGEMPIGGYANLERP